MENNTWTMTFNWDGTEAEWSDPTTWSVSGTTLTLKSTGSSDKPCTVGLSADKKTLTISGNVESDFLGIYTKQ
jgi:hypothetical protein